MKMARIVGVVCALATTSGLAAERRSGDWTWNTEAADLQWAGTENGAGQELGQFCYPQDGHCIYAVSFDTTCKDGDSYPAIVNSDAGAATLNLRCGPRLDNGANLMVVEDFEQIDRIVRSGSRIGFALPMESDAFKAVRFSLHGADTALDRMRSAAARVNSPSRDVKQAKTTEVF
jgi:hypothetical protein